MNHSYHDASAPDETLPKKVELKNDAFDHRAVVKTMIEAVPGAFTLEGILTEKECNKLVKYIYKKGKAPSDSVPVLFRGWAEDPEKEYGKLGQKKFYSSEDFASQLYERLKPFFPQEVTTTRPSGAELNWKIHGLTHRHRFLCYQPGQEFPPHMDAPFKKTNQIESHYTVLFYLDDCKESGELSFLKPTEEENGTEPVHTLHPKRGLVLAFPHKNLHSSSPMKEGEQKFLIRNDVLYEIVN